MSENLRKLFDGGFFRIPDYQRGYAWEEKQLLELWDDLDAIPTDKGGFKKHYTGTIYLEETKPEENEQWLSGATFYHVVDGQQRLTTISILIFELLKLANEGHGGESKDDLVKAYICKTNASKKSSLYKFSYASTDNNFNFLLRNIFEDHAYITYDNRLNHYTQNLQKAKAFFANKLNELSYSQREELFIKITTSLQFDIRKIEEDLDVQAVFETMNNRGKPLSTLEKLKNRLIYLATKLPHPAEDQKRLRKSINDAWGKIYSCLAQNAAQILDEDVFLSAHLSLYRKPKDLVFSEAGSEEKVFQMFCNKSEKYYKDESGEIESKVTFEKIEDYILKLSAAAPVWHQIHNSNSLILRKIQLLNNGKEVKVFLLSLLLKYSLLELTDVFSNFEKILFRNRTVGFFDERIAATWGHDLYTDECSLDDIKSDLNDLIHRPISSATLVQEMNRRFTYERGAKGFYRWSVLKYFLFDYEEHLKKKFGETDDKVLLSNYHNTTIEHIIPQEWSEFWSDEMNGLSLGLQPEMKILAETVLINTLGNLTILKYDKNPSLGKKSWVDKKLRFKTGSYNEIDVALRTNWTKKEIAERGVDMLGFLQTRIKGLNLSAEELMKLLFFEDAIIKKIKE